MANICLSKVEIRKETIPEDLVVCDLAVGAGAFLVQFARLIANIWNRYWNNFRKTCYWIRYRFTYCNYVASVSTSNALS